MRYFRKMFDTMAELPHSMGKGTQVRTRNIQYAGGADMKYLVQWCAVLVLSIIVSAPGSLGAQSRLSTGQIIYVPVYSHIYHGDREKHIILLAATLSVRNIDLSKSLTILSVDYYDTKGNLIEKYINRPVTLKPLESVRYLVKESDMRGGSGANFIVKWKADVPVNRPIFEAVMIGARGQQGISFTSRGHEIFDK